MSGLKTSAYSLADEGVDPVGRHHQIVILPIVLGRFELGLELQVHAQLPRPVLQQQEQLHPPDPGKAMPARNDPFAPMHHGDIVPIGEAALDRVIGLRVVLLHPRHGVVGQDHPPAERVIGAVPLQHRHLMRRVAQLHRDREIEARRATPKAKNLHLTLLESVRPSSLPPGENNFKLEISSLKFSHARCRIPLWRR